MSSPALFALAGVRVRFDSLVALNVNALTIDAGCTTVLVGDNGSGKTTLLRVLNGLLVPDEGTVSFLDRPLDRDGLAAARASSVLVHERPLLFRGSVGFNVAYGLRLRGLPRDEVRRRTSEALAAVGLPGFEPRRISALSGGERQRVALARALALEPRVLLLDEPTANVDASSRREIEAMIRRARDGGASVVMSTHDQALAYRLSDRLLRMQAGAAAESGENVLKGSVESVDEQYAYFRTGSALLRCPARSGDFVVAVVPCDELILSREPLASSARNQLRATVTAVTPGPADGLLSVEVDCGARFSALVTRESCRELGVEPGASCMVTFKASAVRLY